MVGLFALVLAAVALRLPLVAVSAVATGVLIVVAVLDQADIFTFRRTRPR
ncbi:hypothetical protein [Micromonospora sp. NBC_00858]|nr:hypothetical protein OG990_28140 [Micromonospora sp. NBC_00858]